MPRARNLKPSFFTDAEVVECAPWVRLLFAGLWTLADREGRLKDRPKQIAIELFPRDPFDVDAGLNELHARGLIVRYVADGTSYIQVTNFQRHQNPHRDERQSTIPPPSEHCAGTVQTPYSHDASPAESITYNLSPESTSSAAPRARAHEGPSPNGAAPHPAEAAADLELPTTTVRPVPPAVTAFEREWGAERFGRLCQEFATVNVQLDASWLRRTLGQLEVQGHGLSPPAYRDAVKQAFLVIEDALKRENQIRNPRAYAAKQVEAAVKDASKAVAT